MTRIDFYILKDVAIPALHRFACRLATKALPRGHPVVLHAPDEATAREVDELLWHYPNYRFIPHRLEDGSTGPEAPVRITWQEPTRFDGLLVNLGTSVPEFFGRFDRVAEIVVEENRAAGRERYQFYKHRGYPLYYHNLDDWEAPATH